MLVNEKVVERRSRGTVQKRYDNDSGLSFMRVGHTSPASDRNPLGYLFPSSSQCISLKKIRPNSQQGKWCHNMNDKAMMCSQGETT